MKIDFTSAFVTGGVSVRSRIEGTRMFYGSGCADYFDELLSRKGEAFRESAAGFLLLDNLLQKNRIDRLSLEIKIGENGRPSTNRPDVDFSISHSEGCAVCALAVGDGASVGVDVQKARDYSPEKMTQLAKTFMSDEELAAFYYSNKKNGDFFTAWTHRESFVKRNGSDIFENLKNADIRGENFRDGIIFCCGQQYYYSINFPADCPVEGQADDKENK